jgi:DNA-binding CsgD family transcriptional regulator
MKFKRRELTEIAENIRINITGGRGVTLSDYVQLAESKKGDEIGLFYLWVLKNNPATTEYFPPKVLEVLKKKGGRHYYTDEDNEFIRQHASEGIRSLVTHINVPPASAYKQARLLGVKVPRSDYFPYSEREKEEILTADLSKTDEQIGSDLFGRTAAAVQHKRLLAGIKRREIIKWEDFPEKEKYLVRAFGRRTYAQIAQTLGLRYHQVKTKVERLKAEGRIKKLI